MSFIQQVVKDQIKLWIPSNFRIKENYRPKWLHGLEIDLYIPKLKLAIEVNGLQHYIKTDIFHKRNSDFELQVARDYAKELIIKNENIKFIKVRQGNNLLNGLSKQMQAILGAEFLLDETLKSCYEKHWQDNKNKFLNGKENPSFVKITFSKNQKQEYTHLIQNKEYGRAIEYIKTNAFFL